MKDVVSGTLRCPLPVNYRKGKGEERSADFLPFHHDPLYWGQGGDRVEGV